MFRLPSALKKLRKRPKSRNCWYVQPWKITLNLKQFWVATPSLNRHSSHCASHLSSERRYKEGKSTSVRDDVSDYLPPATFSEKHYWLYILWNQRNLPWRKQMKTTRHNTQQSPVEEKMESSTRNRYSGHNREIDQSTMLDHRLTAQVYASWHPEELKARRKRSMEISSTILIVERASSNNSLTQSFKMEGSLDHQVSDARYLRNIDRVNSVCTPVFSAPISHILVVLHKIGRYFA